MIKKLQRHFMLVSTLVLLLVVSLVVIAVYTISSAMVMSQTSVLMNVILDNDGLLPDRSEFDTDQKTILPVNAESFYESRFFTVQKEDDTLSVISMHVTALSKTEAISLAEKILARRPDLGRIRFSGSRVLHYMRRKNGSTAMLVVLDATSRYDLIRLIMISMSLLWSSVLALYVVIMGHFSQKLILPFLENDERQKRFITNASHELKTPLAVISANTEMTEVLSGSNKWTQSTRRQISRLQALIEDLVVLTRLDEMKEAELTVVDLSAIVTETAEPFRTVSESGGKGFVTRIQPDIRIKGDKRGLQQVASILLDNAVKYCDENGEITVSLDSRARGKGARLIVSNTYAEGKGADTSRFFERFYRHDESHNSRKSGFGIGLSMAKEIVERMKGKLKVSYAEDTIRFIVEV